MEFYYVNNITQLCLQVFVVGALLTTLSVMPETSEVYYRELSFTRGRVMQYDKVAIIEMRPVSSVIVNPDDPHVSRIVS